MSDLTQEEAEERRDAILKRMLQTKPKPHKDMIKERRKNEPKRRRKGATKQGNRASHE